jgi:peptidoglycan/LPS O-acetylase OafA/YrhL
MYSKKVPFDDQLAAISVFTVLATLFFGGYAALGTPAFVYFILWLGARLPKAFQWIGAKNDYSYGIYIYGFLVQQMLAFFEIYKWGYFIYVFLTLLFTVPLAWLSWHIVEKQAMALKDWGPGKGLSFLYFPRKSKRNSSA